MDFESKTVLELRKIARENNIRLSAGINKAEIIERLQEALSPEKTSNAVQLNMLSEFPEAPEADEQSRGAEEKEAPAQTADAGEEEPLQDNESGEDGSEEQEEEPRNTVSPLSPYASPIPPIPARTPQSAVPVRPAASPVKGTQPVYRSSWHNSQSSGQNKFTPQQRTQTAGWNSAPARPQTETSRPSFGPSASGFGPRFGPSASGFGPQSDPEPSPAQSTESSEESPARSFTPPAASRPYDQRSFTRTPSPSRSYGNDRPAYSGRTYTQDAQQVRREPVELPSIEELITPAECPEAKGILEVLPDGYGFLRSDSLLPSSRDLYVSSALVRRYELRSGDFVTGRVRPARDGDKYSALLYVTDVNGTAADALTPRTLFDDLTPVYSSRRLNLDDSRYPDIRLMDLLAPIGYGNRALLLFPPDCGKKTFLQHLTEVITSQNENADVLMLLLDFAPEEVTNIRDAVSCPVLASTFDQTPEIQMRLIDLAQERAHRLAESGRDVILIVDSLTRLVKTFAAASPSARQSGSMINPSALFRAKKLFGAARCAREGGSLTVIATMDIESGVKLDDSIVEEFRANANMEITFDSSIARMGIYPAIHYQRTRSHRTELLLDSREQEGMEALRDLLSSGSPANAVQQLLGLIDKVGHNQDVLLKIKNWSALMSGRPN